MIGLTTITLVVCAVECVNHKADATAIPHTLATTIQRILDFRGRGVS